MPVFLKRPALKSYLPANVTGTKIKTSCFLSGTSKHLIHHKDSTRYSLCQLLFILYIVFSFHFIKQNNKILIFCPKCPYLESDISLHIPAVIHPLSFDTLCPLSLHHVSQTPPRIPYHPDRLLLQAPCPARLPMPQKLPSVRA